MNTVITKELLDNAYSYQSYTDLITNLVSGNKTTGPNQSEKNIYFTKLNLARTKRIEKTTIISDDLKNEDTRIEEPIIFLVIVEAWCGDVAQNLPVIYKIADLNLNIELRIILRDENLNVMNEFLTNGGKAIPICIILKKGSLQVLAKWGPRPEPAQAMMIEYKKTKSVPYEEVSKNIQLWYAQDKTRTLQNEFLNLLRRLNMD